VSRRLPRLALSSSAAALALLLAAPSAALADDHGKGGDHGKSGDHASQAKDEDGHNPPGNNGTIKIDYPAPADSGHANRPHPGCAFQLRMFNFDDDQYGTITFVGQAPTKLGTLLTQTHMLLSDDAAGGGQDVDSVYSYTAQQLGLIGKPQAKQGWHIKVSVDADNAPGGAKHKVFWLNCPTTTAPTTAGSGTAGTTSGAATGASTVTTKSVATSTSAVATSSTTQAATSATRISAAGRAAAVSGTSGAAATRSTPATGRTSAVAATRGSALPFTGFALGSAIVLALAVLLAGALAIRAGRRRTATDL
jgi:hypothetical protein